jgi:hypothetical protein
MQIDMSSAVLTGKPQCVCTTPLGLPVVPEVNISRKGSSAGIASVGTAVQSSGAPAASSCHQ